MSGTVAPGHMLLHRARDARGPSAGERPGFGECHVTNRGEQANRRGYDRARRRITVAPGRVRQRALMSLHGLSDTQKPEAQSDSECGSCARCLHVCCPFVCCQRLNHIVGKKVAQARKLFNAPGLPSECLPCLRTSLIQIKRLGGRILGSPLRVGARGAARAKLRESQQGVDTGPNEKRSCGVTDHSFRHVRA
jgi:hypothetical protein